MNLVRPNFERLELIHAEGRSERYVCRVAPAGHQHTADTGHVVASVEGVPLSAQLSFEPGAEIHGTIDRRHANVPQVTRGIARGNVHGAA